MKDWVEEVIRRCAENGGQITAEEVSKIVPSRTMTIQRGAKAINGLRSNPEVKVEVVDRKRVKRGWGMATIAYYRITRKVFSEQNPSA